MVLIALRVLARNPERTPSTIIVEGMMCEIFERRIILSIYDSAHDANRLPCNTDRAAALGTKPHALAHSATTTAAKAVSTTALGCGLDLVLHLSLVAFSFPQRRMRKRQKTVQKKMMRERPLK